MKTKLKGMNKNWNFKQKILAGDIGGLKL
jgi:hypothetical protein